MPSVPRRSLAAFGSALALAHAFALRAPAAAAVDTQLAVGPAESRNPPGSPAGSRPFLKVSQLGDRGDHDLYCPHALEPSPLVVIAPARGQPRDALRVMAIRLASDGFV